MIHSGASGHKNAAAAVITTGVITAQGCVRHTYRLNVEVMLLINIQQGIMVDTIRII